MLTLYTLTFLSDANTQQHMPSVTSVMSHPNRQQQLIKNQNESINNQTCPHHLFGHTKSYRRQFRKCSGTFVKFNKRKSPVQSLYKTNVIFPTVLQSSFSPPEGALSCDAPCGNKPQISLQTQSVDSLSTSLYIHVLALSVRLSAWQRPAGSKGQSFGTERCQRQTDRCLTVHRSRSRRRILCLSCGRRDKGSGGSSSPEWSNQDSNTSSSRSIRSILALIWW